ncbi:hypothetical protein [Paenibacillus alba]|uniref:Uncharacterized protein n=1 Tax=Paenibacillus alba TaxID=1197127 RepID=A0ABU6GAT2_9BACL|nr:hypothetical protein [Paenibacillus alba]MEC0231306.1 hypothetical protein [Paenibacillus alba]
MNTNVYVHVNERLQQRRNELEEFVSRIDDAQREDWLSSYGADYERQKASIQIMLNKCHTLSIITG